MKTSPLAALDKAEDLIVSRLPPHDLIGPEVRETLRAIRAARAEILRQAVEAAAEVDVSCRCEACEDARRTLGIVRESTRRDPARRGMSD
jgi:hypothetical protein